jgi:hypothetical protein
MQLRCGAARGGLASKNVSNGGRVRGATLSAPKSASRTLNAFVGLAACNELHAGSVVSRSASAPFGKAVRCNARRAKGAFGARAMFERFTEVRFFLFSFFFLAVADASRPPTFDGGLR